MVKLYNISDWYEQTWWNTGGTRDKKIYVNPEDGQSYFFKQSFKKGDRDYKYEFWSEIIASQLGRLLQFDVLTYDIAIHCEIVGCISPNMIDQTIEQLVEGGKYLSAFDNSFKPEKTELRYKYDFQLIYDSLHALKKEKYIKDIVDIIVFDALIGNSDRHQENWAIININSPITQGMDELEKSLIAGKSAHMPNWLFKVLKNILFHKGKLRFEFQSTKLILQQDTRMAPIYDSGCSFGRELSEMHIEKKMDNPDELKKYVMKGLSEIHWKGKKLTHFELVEKLLLTSSTYKFAIDSIEQIISNYNAEKINEIISNVDQKLVELKKNEGLSIVRKQMISNLLTLRFENLRALYIQFK